MYKNLLKDIEKEKNKLIGIAKTKGIYENFGQKEVRKLFSKYGETLEKRKLILSFEDWCMNFEG